MKRRGGRGWAGIASAGAALLVAVAGLAQPTRDPRDPGSDLVQPRPEPPGGPAVDASCAEAELFGGTTLERAAWCHAREARWASVRTLARRALDNDAESVRAHYLMGLAQHLGEANLPKARYHLRRAEALLDERFGAYLPPVPELAMLRQRVLLELVYVHGEMDDHEGKLAYVKRLSRDAEVEYEVLAAWPLLKLERFDEAREVAERHAQSEHDFIRSIARTALCAVESEQRHRVAAYEACRAAAEAHAGDPSDGAVEFTNAGAAAEEMAKLDEAERFYLEATLREPEGTVNPWGRLVQLYTRQGRLAEALTSWRRLVAYRDRRPNAHLRQQDEADAAATGASLLLVAGRSERAASVAQRLVERPDRKGTSSAAAEQAEAGLAVLDHVAQRTWANRLAERASYGTWGDAAHLRPASWLARYRSWASGRRALKILADEERLATTLRPEAPGSIEGPVWLDPDVVALVGSGVALEAVRRSRAEETLPARSAEPVFALLEAEAHAVAGRWAAAGRRAEAALEGLPSADRMLRARAHLRAGQAARSAGRHDDARAHFGRVLERDPGLFRRLGDAIPVRVLHPRGDGPWAEVAEMVADSPRFRAASWGFELRVDDRGATLTGPAGNQLRQLSWPAPEAEQTADAHLRRCVDVLHDRLLAPPIDLTQADVRSLDGTIGGGLDADAMLDGILKEDE
jgi:tetratricopeptide (TPR) repeat protein